jgi:prepilin-type N-terminal cleavage/methylation domain-containing protein
MDTQTQQGFTLYELMITLAVVSIVLAFGLPNLAEFRQNGRMTATANDFHAAFHMARSEAARSKSNITICASADPFGANSTCDGTWDQGFIVFIDGDADQNRFGAGENVLRAHGPAQTGVNLRIANNATYFMFASTGLGRMDTAGNPTVSQIVMCDDRGNVRGPGGGSAARLFVSTPLGRATIVRDIPMIDNALTAMGQACP